jgi:hypothetical protein
MMSTSRLPRPPTLAAEFQVGGRATARQAPPVLLHWTWLYANRSTDGAVVCSGARRWITCPRWQLPRLQTEQQHPTPWCWCARMEHGACSLLEPAPEYTAALRAYSYITNPHSWSSSYSYNYFSPRFSRQQYTHTLVGKSYGKVNDATRQYSSMQHEYSHSAQQQAASGCARYTCGVYL